jgi:phosphoenolpyruvate carboxykinase (ATP)
LLPSFMLVPDAEHYLPVQVTAQYAWHCLFGSTLFIKPGDNYNPSSKEVWQIMSAPEFTCDPTVTAPTPMAQ